MKYRAAIVAAILGNSSASAPTQVHVAINGSYRIRPDLFAAIRTSKCIHDPSLASDFPLVRTLLKHGRCQTKRDRQAMCYQQTARKSVTLCLSADSKCCLLYTSPSPRD